MKKKDIILIFYILVIIGVFVFPITRTYIEKQTLNYPYLLGFIKTAILATSGELMASRIMTGNYFSKNGIHLRLLVWGILGMGFVLMFSIYDGGVHFAIQNELLPSLDLNHFLDKLYPAFMISLIMNLTFAPAFMLLHRVTDTTIDLAQGKISQIHRVKLSKISENIDWHNFFQFILVKTIPLFWIPAHTITFLLPSQYRVLMAGFLSIALGLILTLSKIMKQKQV
jgi:hypothetical protein